MKFRIVGQNMQALDLLLGRGEAVFTEVGGMAWYKGQVDMKTNMPGGMMGGLGRAFSGESLFLTTYTALSDQVEITFTPEAPGSIVNLELTAGQLGPIERAGPGDKDVYLEHRLEMDQVERTVFLDGAESIILSWPSCGGTCCAH